MRKWVIFLLLFFVPALASADTIVHTPDGFRGAAEDGAGNALLLTQVTETVNGLATNISAQATLLSRERGALWSVKIGGNGEDELRQAVFTGDGWLCVGASSSTDLQNGWHAGTYDDKEGKSDGFIVKLSLEGEVRFTRCYGGSDWDRLRGVCKASGGGFIAVGETFSRDGDVVGWHDSGELFDKPDGWILRLTEEGDLLWQTTLGGSESDSLFAVVPVAGGYLAVGETNSTDGDVPAGERSWSDGWVVLISETGECLRSLTYGGDLDDGFRALAKGTDGVLAGGYSRSKTDPSYLVNAWAARLSDEGDLLFETRFGRKSADYIRAISWIAPDAFAMAGFSQAPLADEASHWVARIGADGEGLALVSGSFDAPRNKADPK